MLRDSLWRTAAQHHLMSLRYKRPPGFRRHGGGDGRDRRDLARGTRAGARPRSRVGPGLLRRRDAGRRRARPGHARALARGRLPLSRSACRSGRPGPDAVLRYVNCAGGGWGDPLERDPDLVRRDVRDGYVTIAGAARDYGVVVSGRPRAATPRGSCSTSRRRRAARVDAGRPEHRRRGARRARRARCGRCWSSRRRETERRTYYSQETPRGLRRGGLLPHARAAALRRPRGRPRRRSCAS